MDKEKAKKEIERLSSELEHHNRLYYIDAEPEISDREYDEMYRSLEILEKEFPEFASANSPTRRVGGEPIEGFVQQEHRVPMLSIDDVFSKEEVGEFFRRLQKNLGEDSIPVTIEPKIDGVAVALHYRNGELESAITRGDGAVGDVITENVRTIRNVPLRLSGKAPDWFEVRGEIFMPNEGFAKLNEARDEEGLPTFKNPRNATAGALKLLDSREVAKRPLDFIAHGHGFVEGVDLGSSTEFRELLRQYGIRPNEPFWEAATLEEIIEAIDVLDEKRHSLAFGTDGAVIKVVDFRVREQLGFTSRAPRWAAAFKYPPEQKETVLNEITVQVGRTGTLTPVAELEPVLVSGTTVRRATLHNQDEIDRKDVRIGDTVLIEKAGEIIPAVIKVVLEKRPPEAEKFNLYDFVEGKCPSCGSAIERPEGFVAWKCMNPVCPAKLANRLKQFVSRKALDIEGVGTIVAEKLVERKVVDSLTDIFRLESSTLKDLNLGTEEEPRMLGEKNATKIVDTAKRARTSPLNKWIFALGIPQVGESAGRELSRLHENFSELSDSEILRELKTLKPGQPKEKNELLKDYQIAGEVGPTVASSVVDYFESDAGQELLEKLKALGIDPQSENYAPRPSEVKGSDDLPLAGKTLVITGTLSAGRSEIKGLIEQKGGKVSGSISGNTDYLLAGEGGGSKRDKAESLGVPIISEEDLNALIGEN
ncbi:MAG: DNA ligase (NAD(+)) LigA [Verrucomicrobiales bacterium]|nr:DNA ligase (NAD(+)) LigA [Verrucomicrobiales bacterium]